MRAAVRIFGSRKYVGYGPLKYFAKKNALIRVFLRDAPVIETGTYLGDTSRDFAKLGYEVHTIEISRGLSDAVFPMLKEMGVNCYSGDSAILLPQIIQRIFGSGTNEANSGWMGIGAAE